MKATSVNVVMNNILAPAVWRHCINFEGSLFGAKQGLAAGLQGRIQDFGTEVGTTVEDFEVSGQSKRGDAEGIAGESARRD